MGVPQQRQTRVAVFSAIVILIRGIWPQWTSSDPLICNLSKLAGADELTSKTQLDSLTPLSRQILFDLLDRSDNIPRRLKKKTVGIILVFWNLKFQLNLPQFCDLNRPLISLNYLNHRFFMYRK